MPTRITASVDPDRVRIASRTEDGHSVVVAADPPHGDGSASSPKEAILAALAGCTAVDVVSILRKKQQTLRSYEIEVTAESAPEHPKVFTRITVEHRVAGDVTAEALRRSIELSVTRYCPVNAMLSASVTIEHRYRLIADDGGAVGDVVAVVGPGRPLR